MWTCVKRKKSVRRRNKQNQEHRNIAALSIQLSYKHIHHLLKVFIQKMTRKQRKQVKLPHVKKDCSRKPKIFLNTNFLIQLKAVWKPWRHKTTVFCPLCSHMVKITAPMYLLIGKRRSEKFEQIKKKEDSAPMQIKLLLTAAINYCWHTIFSIYDEVPLKCTRQNHLPPFPGC